MGPFPVFYWPRIVTDLDDLEPPLRMIGFNTNNYFGQQLKADWNGFRLLGLRRPKWIDMWNVDVDYLSARTKQFPAVGSEMGWFGSDLIRDLNDPYHKDHKPQDHITKNYFGYFDIWGLEGLAGIDVLGTGPAIVTNGPARRGQGRIPAHAPDPPFQEERGRFNFRHNQRFLPEDEDHEFEELRLQLEVGYASDRNFIEEYYKTALRYGHGPGNAALRNLAEGQPVRRTSGPRPTCRTGTPTPSGSRASITTGWATRCSRTCSLTTPHSGMDYATIHTDVMVNNPNLFAFLPLRPDLEHDGDVFVGAVLHQPRAGHAAEYRERGPLRAVRSGSGRGVDGPARRRPARASADWRDGAILGRGGLRGEVTACKMYPERLRAISGTSTG